MEVVIFILGFIIFVAIVIYALTYKTKSDKEYDKKLEERLNEEFLIDPETGARMTLDQAESGHWISHDNEYRGTHDSDIENLLSPDEQQVEIALNYLRESREYQKTNLTDEQHELFSKTIILSKYKHWSYSYPFSFKDGLFILPAPKIERQTYYQENYQESQVMFLKKISNIKGHYYLREKSTSEKIFDKFRNDDELKLDNYESFTIEKSFDIIQINELLKNFENQENLEIELHDEHLFVKTMRLARIEDIRRIEKIIKNVG